MTISVRITREDLHSNHDVGVYTLDKKSKKSTLFTKLTDGGSSAVVPVYDNQDIIVREIEN